MSGFIGRVVGAKGCNLFTATTATPPNGAKITAIGFYTSANITNYKHTPKSSNSSLNQVTVSTKGYMGSLLSPGGVLDYIPLDHPADSVVIAAGSVMCYFD